jgi:methylthioribulose-1-phosphate dehydratase
VAGHGLYTWGRSIDAARRHIEAYEFLLECVARRTTFEAFRG